MVRNINCLNIKSHYLHYKKYLFQKKYKNITNHQISTVLFVLFRLRLYKICINKKKRVTLQINRHQASSVMAN